MKRTVFKLTTQDNKTREGMRRAIDDRIREELYIGHNVGFEPLENVGEDSIDCREVPASIVRPRNLHHALPYE